MKDKDLNFEKALADLEAVVEKLEKGGLSLNDSLAQFEKGVKLARFLRTELEKAEKRVEILLKDEKGEIKAAPFGLDEKEGGEAGEDEDEDDDDEDAGSGDASKPAEKEKPPRGGKKKDDDTSLPF
jgi:exodeoxyribonuclease VII small subunit